MRMVFKSGAIFVRVLISVKGNKKPLFNNIITNSRKLSTNNALHERVLEDVLPKTNALFDDFTRSEELRQQNWDKFQKEITSKFRKVKKENFQSILMDYFNVTNQFELGKAFMNHLDRSSKPNVMSMANYVVLCGKNNHKEEMLLYINKIPKEYLLNGMVVRLITDGLTSSSLWRESIPILEQLEKSTNTVDNSLRNKIASAAFKNHDFETGVALFKEIEKKFLRQHHEGTVNTIRFWIEAISDHTFSDLKRHTLLDDFLTVTSGMEIFLPAKFITWLHKTLERTFHHQAKLVEIDGHDIHCPSCGKQLETIELTDDEFGILREQMEHTLLKGQDVYRNSSPAEMAKFKAFLCNAKPYTLVVDGLNLSLNHGMSTNANAATLLLNAVRFLQNTGNHSILILGRKHMEKWSSEIMSEIWKISQVFLLANLSEDDPFILYSAIYGGKNTKFISNDLMRNHLFKFEDNQRIKDLFFHWKRSHQMFITKTTRGFATTGPDKTGARLQGTLIDGFHFPSSDVDPYRLSRLWLCSKGKLL